MKQILKLSFLSFVLLSLIACGGKSDGESAKTEEAGEVAKAETANKYVVNAGSQLTWTGEKPTGKHSGTIDVSKGSISVADGTIKAGSFTIDMNSIKNTDMAGSDGAGKLEGHLKNADFFDVAVHPTSMFEITKVTGLENDPSASHIISGNLTMKGITKQISFRAKVDMSKNGVSVSTPPFTINRADWEIKYGSKSFFDDLKDKFINDDIELTINLTGNAG